MNKVPFDPAKDFAPISVVGTNPFVLIVNKDVPAKSVAEFVAWVKAQPNKLSYAEGSAGSVTHLSMALFLKRAGLDMTNVSYRGNAPALTDVIAGHLPTMFSNLSDALPHAATGAIRIIAVSSAQRVAQIKDVPTIAEARLSRLRGRDMERPDGAGRHAEANRRPDRGGDRQGRERAEVRRAPDLVRRRPLRHHAAAVHDTNRIRPQDCGRRRSRSPGVKTK